MLVYLFFYAILSLTFLFFDELLTKKFMEKNIIISKMLEKEVYDIKSCTKTSNETCRLVLQKQDTKMVRDGLSYLQVSSLMKKNNFFWGILYGKKYASEYVVHVFPYYDSGWKRFVWSEKIDENLLCQHKEIPYKLSKFLNLYEKMQTLFVKGLKSCLQNYPNAESCTLSPVLDLYWAEFLCLYFDKTRALNRLRVLLQAISKDTRILNNANKPLSIEKYLCMSQYIDNEKCDYEVLAQTYIKSIYEYLLFCYQADLSSLTDIYGTKENIGEFVSIEHYKNYLLLFDAVDEVIAYLDFD